MEKSFFSVFEKKFSVLFRCAGIRCKLIAIFVLIKVLPLILLAWFAVSEISGLGVKIDQRSNEMLAETQRLVVQISDLAGENSIAALDLKSRESIERLTTITARAVADFLYQRDADIRLAARLDPGCQNFIDFLEMRQRPVVYHKPWQLNSAGDAWVPSGEDFEQTQVFPENSDNQNSFHYRDPQKMGLVKDLPLYLEMTFVDLKGQEKCKITTTDLLSEELFDVSKKNNTWCRAETYFAQLANLKPGEIYVSEVIGAYLPSPLIGVYTRASCLAKGIPFAPDEAAYAGKENPVGVNVSRV